MKITLKLFATLRDHMKNHSNGSCEVTLHETATVQDVFASFRIPDDIPKIILINGVQMSACDVLHDGDTLSVFPPIAGG
jgi:molybdopterin converting factor small subunit